MSAETLLRGRPTALAEIRRPPVDEPRDGGLVWLAALLVLGGDELRGLLLGEETDEGGEAR